MPSLHFAWAFLIGVATICIARAWWLKLVGALLPVGMFVAIIATGNHFILDAVGGALVIGLAYGLVLLFPRVREQAKVFGGSADVGKGLTADGGQA
jgi:membrane-associated phospholipid phosphatase